MAPPAGIPGAAHRALACVFKGLRPGLASGASVARWGAGRCRHSPAPWTWTGGCDHDTTRRSEVASRRRGPDAGPDGVRDPRHDGRRGGCDRRRRPTPRTPAGRPRAARARAPRAARGATAPRSAPRAPRCSRRCPHPRTSASRPRCATSTSTSIAPTLRAEDARILESNARWLLAHPGTLVLIEGHADARGTNEYNLALGESRARVTRDQLVARGVAASRITILSYGEERPTCRETSEACWGNNRRAHFLVKSAVTVSSVRQ